MPAPFLSPFRFPGGKSWLVPRVLSWLEGPQRRGTFLEPFAGGASVALAVAHEGLVRTVEMLTSSPT